MNAKEFKEINSWGRYGLFFTTRIIITYMYLAYSALRTNNHKNLEANSINSELSLRYQAYLNTCIKYRQYIAEIQKYMPGWIPNPPTL